MVATPHVAGYSEDGKRNGTWMVYEKFCAWAGMAPGRRADGDRRLSLAVSRADALTEALEGVAAAFPDNQEPVVWPDPAGDARGESLEPIYKSAPAAARRDSELYELLVISDALRAGRARERQAAVKELRKRLRDYG